MADQLEEKRIKLLPIGNATFRDVVRGDYLYVDKTRYIHKLVGHYKGVYFLSRPRRFGKSLMLSTLDEIFRGDRELFKGLWIYEQSDYDWTPHPVIRLDFSAGHIDSPEALEDFLNFDLQWIAETYAVELSGYDHQSRFQNLIRQLARKNKVVILIDEYDKPILDNLDNIEVADQIRRVLKSFYGVIKAMDSHIRLVFITGISKFSKVSLFSDLNNLEDLSLRTDMGASVGITEGELQKYFEDHIAALATKKEIPPEALLAQIRRWYNGFCFAPEAENVYNPFSTLLLFQGKRFTNYWFETATPTFLINLIHQNNYDVESLHNIQVSEMAFSTYHIKQLEIIPLMVQAGYLTIKEYDEATQIYTLSYPNYEVENAFLVYLLDAFSYTQQGLSESHLVKMVEALRVGNLNTFFTTLKVLFANIVYDLHLKNEKYYQTIFYLVFKLIGLRIDAEVKTNSGRIDAVVELIDHIYIFEFKLDKSAMVALDQIKNNAYYEKYLLHGKLITQVGANFNSDQRTITGWEDEPVDLSQE